MKKLLVSLLLILLTACSAQAIDDKPIPEIKEYIEPSSDVEIFDYLNKETHDLLYKANNNEDIKAYILEYLGKDLVDYTFTDYYGNQYNLGDFSDKKLMIEVSANWCTHCMKQASEYNDDLLANYQDICIIQYFNEGNKELIDAFYKEIGKPIPSNIIVVPEDEMFSNLLLSNYNPMYYPGFLLFNEGKLTFMRIAEFTKEEMDLAYDVAYNNALDLNKLTDENGKSIFTYRRSTNDVKEDLSEENIHKLEQLDNDHYTVNETLKFMGRKFDFYNQLENDSNFNAETNFLEYEDKNLVIVYLYEPDEQSIQLINDYYDGHGEDISVVVLNTADLGCEKMAEQISPPVISIMNQVPEILNDINFVSYPSCVFVEKGTITGTYSNIENIEMFNKATDMFIGDNSIALKNNN